MNTEQYNLILAGVEAWNEWRKESPEVTPDLRKADLQEADLQWATLRGADLRGADLRGADLYKADLREADLYKADLYKADLQWATLRGADLRGADLYKADLRGADLYKADLRGADLRWAQNTQGIFTFGPAGSRNDITIYIAEYDQLRCGCWTGTLEEFAETVEDVHESNPVFLAQYRAGIAYLKEMKKIWEENQGRGF